MKFSIFILLAALISGCATLSEEECRRSDWYNIGFQDGLNGSPLSRMAGHREACAKYSILLDKHKYMRGYDEGLDRYCVPTNGYVIGRKGKTYHGVCSGANAELFLENYMKGKRAYDIERRLSGISREIDDIEKTLDDKKDLNKDERRLLRRKLIELERERTVLYMRNKDMDIDTFPYQW